MFSSAILLTTGVKNFFSVKLDLIETFFWTTGFDSIFFSTTISSFSSTGFSITEAFESVSTLAITAPTSITSFGFPIISINTPSVELGISESTLSVPISRIISSILIASPTFFLHSIMVPSVMDSPIFGITISTIINTPIIQLMHFEYHYFELTPFLLNANYKAHVHQLSLLF